MAEIIVALDFPEVDQALRLVDTLDESIRYYKVGSELFTRGGPSVVEELQQREKSVFLDLKFHDIPNTVAGAVRSAAELGVDMLTLHAQGGTAMMRAALDAVDATGPRLIGVTLLTSSTADDVQEVWGKELRSIREEVARVAALASAAGLHGVVASAAEAEVVKRRHGPAFLVITPGIRPSGDSTGDQVRTATPADAVRAGSDFLVIGRPITQAAKPSAVVSRILEDMASVTPEVAR